MLAVYSLTCGSVTAQKSSEKIKAEIMETLKQWNNAGKNANLDQIMALYDNTDNIFMAGSDSGEIFKGKDQIKGWLALLLKNNSFSWEMNRIDIDYNGKTAWVFVDGAMIVTNSKGKSRRTPYRFIGVLVNKNGNWKWRLFNGSVPQGH